MKLFFSKQIIRWRWQLYLFVLPINVFATCQHFSTELPVMGEPPSFDGIGAFGPLNNTLTLDCLHYIGNIKSEERSMALVSDDRGKRYTLKIGEYIGEDHGILKAIHTDYLVIEQTVANGDRWVSRKVKLNRWQDKSAVK